MRSSKGLLVATATAALCLAGRAHATITAATLGVAFKNNTSSSSAVITTTADCPSGSTEVVLAGNGSYNLALSSVVDSVNSATSYTCSSPYSFSARGRIQACYFNNGVDKPTGTTITATWGSTTGEAEIKAYCVAGLVTSSDLDVTGTGATGNSTTPVASSGTLSQSNEIVFFQEFVNSSTATYTGPVGSWVTDTDVSGAADQAHFGYQIVSSASSVSAATALSAASTWIEQLYSFKGATSGGGGASVPLGTLRRRGMGE